MKVALVYDRVNKHGGAERVIKLLHEIYPNAPLYTLVYSSQNTSWAKDIKVIPTFLNKLSFLRTRHEILSPIAPLAFETFDFSEYDTVISITSSDAKSIITKPNTLHLCYCLTPTRYFWSGLGEYKKDLKLKIIPKFLFKYFRLVDLLTSKRPDEYLSISKTVQKRVQKYYQRDSDIIYPAINDYFFVDKPQTKEKRTFYLAVSRLVPYKKIDLVIKAFNQIGEPLIVIGTGSQEKSLRKNACSNITFLGKVSDQELKKYYQNAKVLIFPQEEDFGLVPLEAQASGTPVIAFAKGGAKETIINKKTGLFFPKQTISSLVKSIADFQTLDIDYNDCIKQAQEFNEKRFKKQFSGKVKTLYQKYHKLNSKI